MAYADAQIQKVTGIVTGKLNSVMGWARQASTAAENALAAIGHMAAPQIKLTAPKGADITAPQTPGSDAPPTTVISISPSTASFNGTGSISLITPREIPAPVYGVPASLPDRPTNILPSPPVNYPTVPVNALPVEMSVAAPVAPVLSLPPSPTFETVAPPTVRMPTLAAFSGALPDDSESNAQLAELVQRVDALIQQGESRYRVKMTDYLNERGQLVQGYEQTITKNYEENLALHRKRLMDGVASKIDRELAVELEKVNTFWASRNFSLVPGMAVDQTNDLQIEGGRKIREQASKINQEIAKLVADDFKLDLEFYVTLEQCLIELHLQQIRQQLAQEKIRVRAQLELFNAALELYNAKATAVNVSVDAYTTNLQAKIEASGAYKTVVDGAIASVAENEARVSVYGSQVQVLKAQTDVYGNQIKAATAPLEAYKGTLVGIKANTDTVVANIEAYREAVRGYAAAVDAATSEIDAFVAQSQAASSTANVYETNARAYAAHIQEAARRNNIYKTFTSEQSEVLSANLQAFREVVSTNEGYLRAHAAKVAAEADVVSARAGAYDKQIRAYSSYNKASADFSAATMSRSMTTAENAARQTALDNQGTAEQAKIDAGSLAARASALAGLAQGAMSAMHVSASAQGSGTTNSGYTGSQSWTSNWGGTTRQSESNIRRATV